DDWEFKLDEELIDTHHLQSAAHSLKHSDVPVAFPTETVYGLGADATRSEAVKGIYKAKQRPVDNPLIVHISSLNQLRQLLRPSGQRGIANGATFDPIPDIYKPLIQKFWPGPLTILLPTPNDSRLAPEVTAGLKTFGARMPGSLLAMVLIKLAGVPLAAPSANASTKPSPTVAEHVKYDLDGRIDTILDGGPCDVGVESTVVDGLSTPPSILRPGGVSIEQLRQCVGWENVVIGYKDSSETGLAPKAPGMKYRHYSPKAQVVLYHANNPQPEWNKVIEEFGPRKSIGFINTKKWNLPKEKMATTAIGSDRGESQSNDAASSPVTSSESKVCVISLGRDTESIARGLFSALRDLDKRGAEMIFVEGIDEQEGATAAAVMNRLRKAAEVEIRD
ncbi:translation factor, partial [Viridothelium virens]